MPIASRKTTAKAAPRKAASKAVAAAVEEVAADGADFSGFLGELRDLVDKYLTPIGTVAVAPKGRKATKAAASVEEPEEVEEEAGDEDELPTRADREAELKKLTVRALRKALVDTGEFEEDDIKSESDKDLLIENLLDYEEEKGELAAADDDEEDDAAEEEGEDEEEEEEEEEEEVDRDQLLGMNIRDLKKLAVSQYNIDAGEVKTADKDTIIDLILGEEADEGDEDEDDEDEYWSEEELQAMPIAEVRGIADDAQIRYTAKQGKDKAALIELITAE